MWSSQSDDAQELDPAGGGYTAVDNYALYFWRPYLGNTAFGLWELLLSFCYGEKNVAFPTLSRLARMLTNSDHSRAVISGRRRSEGGCSPGALATLQRAGLVQVHRRGAGHLCQYRFVVARKLPLLTPEQVATLSPGLQRDHAWWLARRRPDAGGSTPVAAGSSPEVGGDPPDVPGSTKNPQESTPWNRWWEKALGELRLQLTASMYHTCLAPSVPVSWSEGVLTLRAPGALARDVLEHRLAGIVGRELAAASGGQVREVRFE